MTRDGKPIDRAVISNFDFMRGVAGSSVLQAKVGDMCDIVVQESEIPAKPEYVPLEDSLFVQNYERTAAGESQSAGNDLSYVLRLRVHFNSS